MDLLIADDEKFFAENLMQLLKVENSFNIDLAFDGNEALRLIKNGRYDAYILDINLPFQTGDILAQVITEKYVTPKIVFISAYSELANELRKNFPQFPILEKPFELNTLLKLLN